MLDGINPVVRSTKAHQSKEPERVHSAKLELETIHLLPEVDFPRQHLSTSCFNQLAEKELRPILIVENMFKECLMQFDARILSLLSFTFNLLTFNHCVTNNFVGEIIFFIA